MYILRSASFHYKLHKYTTDEARLRLPPDVVVAWWAVGDHYIWLTQTQLLGCILLIQSNFTILLRRWEK